MTEDMDHVGLEGAERDLGELVERVVTIRSHLTITRDGAPVAVLLPVDEYESVQETASLVSTPEVKESLTEAVISAGRLFREATVRAEYAEDLEIGRLARDRAATGTSVPLSDVAAHVGLNSDDYR